MDKMTFCEMQDILMNELRLMHQPVAITYFYDQDALYAYKESTQYYVPVKPLTFCQAELGARMEGLCMLVEPEKLGCTNAMFVFGWKDLDAGELKTHAKYASEHLEARQIVETKPRLPKALLAVAVQPLGQAVSQPDVVHFYCDNMQAYHLAVDWMSAQGVHPFQANITVNSAACGGNVHAFNSGRANLFLACSGSYNAGKTERGEINVAIPGAHIESVVQRLKSRVDQHGGASITRMGNPFPGADVCKNCPLIVFKRGN